MRVPSDPHLRRWMLFVDGENLTIRAQEFARTKSFALSPGRYYVEDTFLWFKNHRGTASITNSADAPLEVQPNAVRAFYYTSLSGDEKKLLSVRKKIHEAGFSPRVYKKGSKSRKTKAVDIALATDMLSNAYLDNYDVAVLVAGDGDYVPLVAELKRLGKVVYVCFFHDASLGLSDELVLESDHSVEIGNSLMESWNDAEQRGNAV